MAENIVNVKMDSTAIDALAAKVSAIEANLLRCAELIKQVGGRPVDVPMAVNMNDYLRDDHPRMGCTLVVRLSEDSWALEVYAPGFEIEKTPYLISSYFPRNYGSLGIALDAYAAGKTIRSVFPDMAKAERAYSNVSPSATTL